MYPIDPLSPDEATVLSQFTPDAAAALPGPAWLQARRTAAAKRFASSELPSVAEEVWRYSLVGQFDLDRWTPTTGPASAPADLIDDAAVVVRLGGERAEISAIPQAWIDRGVVIAAAGDLDEDVAGLGAVAVDGPDVFASLCDGFAVDPIVISVPRGVILDAPILVVNRGDAADSAIFPRLIVRLGDDAQATVVDIVSSGTDAILSVPFTELEVGSRARLGYLHVQELGSSSWQLGSLVTRVAQEGHVVAALVGLGGHYARMRTDATLAGRGSSGDLLAAYFGEGDQTLDFRTFQHHDAPDTTSNLLFKGAVGGHSRSVYTGLIRVDKEARGTNAFQTNRNVKLSDTAWAESVPNLEIETNDVHCSHASTVGPVDAEQRFYLESRGVTPRTADRLIVAGFFDEVVRALPAASAVEAIRSRVAAKLDRSAEDLR